MDVGMNASQLTLLEWVRVIESENDGGGGEKEMGRLRSVQVLCWADTRAAM